MKAVPMVVDNPVRALALAVIARAVADFSGDDAIAGDDLAPGQARRDAEAFFRDALADGPCSVWFHLAELPPDRVWQAAQEKEARLRAAGKGVRFEQLSIFDSNCFKEVG
ncbi:MAG: hypothetical protein H5T97_02240 [Firmicutes bacterium]|nr:hypothetical protein [Bacillota bacterium]